MRLWNSRDRDDGEPHGYGRAVVFHEADVRDAYDRGRREERERMRRKSHPLIAVAMFGAALVGGAMLFLAIREGSFSRAGEVADHQLALAQAEAPTVIASATQNVGQAARGVRRQAKPSDADGIETVQIETQP
jgi:hypothetical protein